MSLFEQLRDIYWKNHILTEEQKEKFFYAVRGMVRGKTTGNMDESISRAYIKELLAKQDLSNAFSIDYPRTPQIERQPGDPKLLAYYLPQYYPDPHNDLWWGKGSTEWTNVSKAAAQYVGQYQPRYPGELGFYDLRLSENIYRQIELASYFGVYGFSFYYYWFDGERLLDVPFEKFVNDEKITFPFNICWVNESWTKQWEGTSETPLMVQNPSIESYKNFIKSCTHLFTKENYIKIHGRPLLSVYRPLLVPSPEEVTDYWRTYVKKETGLDLYIMGCIVSKSKADYEADYKSLGFDACGEFAPGPHLRMMKNISAEKQFVCDTFYGKVFDYKEFVEGKKYFQLKRDSVYRACSPMWDNTARRKNKGAVLDGATPELYRQWLMDIIVETKESSAMDDQIVFINAWNEWAEGAYLEPDLRWKYGYLEATRDAILGAREIAKIRNKLKSGGYRNHCRLNYRAFPENKLAAQDVKFQRKRQARESQIDLVMQKGGCNGNQ